MKYCAILLCCLLWGAAPAVASPLGADSFFTVDIPEGWTIEAQDKGSVTMLSPDAGIMVSLVTGLNGARSRADIVEEYRKMLDAPNVRPRADDVYRCRGMRGTSPCGACWPWGLTGMCSSCWPGRWMMPRPRPSWIRWP